MAILLSLLTAVVYGAADFFGGVATQRVRVGVVVFGAHVVGLVGVTGAALVMADAFDAGDFMLGGLAGLFALLGVALLYRRLAIGPMAVVAPITAITSAAVPAVWGVLVNNDDLSIVTGFGIVVAFIAIGLISAGEGGVGGSGGGEPGTPGEGRVTAAVIVESLVAGVGFGAFFIVIERTAEEVAPWPVVGSRVSTVAVLVVVALIWRARTGAARTTVGEMRNALSWIVAAGFLDVAANVLFLYASFEGDLTTVSVLSSLYPASTVVLAWAVLKERMTATQFVGFVGALVATGLISAG